MKTELIFFPLPAAGHLLSIVQVAKLLVSRDEELSISFLMMKLSFDPIAYPYVQSLCAETTKGIQYVQLSDPKPEEADSPAKHEHPMASLARAIGRLKLQVKDFIARLKENGSSRVVGFVIDMLCSPMMDVANEIEVPAYVFDPSGAAILGLRPHVQSLVNENHDVKQYMDSDVEHAVSTYINPVPAKLWPQSVLHMNEPSFRDGGKLMTGAKGILVNTFFDLESYAIKALRNIQNMPTIYPVGPLIDINGIRKNQHDTGDILKWLDDQPVSSVVFLCFGSFGSFEGEQVKEIASAIERSGFRFLWSLRRPPPKDRLEYPSEYESPEEVLPEGFLERTSGVGKVIGWAPQAQVLAHEAVGGFVTHCGWNSVLESVYFGVPMATWPMYAEQQMNAFLLVKDLGIAAEIKMDYKKDIMGSARFIVQADEIEDGIRKLMHPEGDMRNKAKELKDKARTALLEGGSSYISLGNFIADFHSFP